MRGWDSLGVQAQLERSGGAGGLDTAVFSSAARGQSSFCLTDAASAGKYIYTYGENECGALGLDCADKGQIEQGRTRSRIDSGRRQACTDCRQACNLTFLPSTTVTVTVCATISCATTTALLPVSSLFCRLSEGCGTAWCRTSTGDGQLNCLGQAGGRLSRL
jgi:hypothetical protein